eukprot:NODE_1181_length_1536_cov_83.856759_g979_i0.p1 GENE.NODE_1181_length_1536_cov_83.856759_g979_i0~~NODE_1181_length_1536_cov_83.856759_g979_i0.p1  ORF type:complete len:418 (-),score=98.54 NODE_1181_length_1536_cov_83.856759_g979_i0:81-1334(-)
MQKYRLMGKKGEGTFSEVLKAQCIKNNKYVAIKCMKNHFESVDQVNRLREIQALRRLSPHPNIIKLYEVLYDRSTGRLALVFELMDMNIYELIRGRRQYLAEEKIQNFMYQLVKGMDHMHRNGIFHRDIKPENVLILGETLKLADFGSCRGIYSKQPFTEYISTRWYRAPECLLTDGYYNYRMDIWGIGCVFFEVMSLYPLFPGTNELDQVNKIHNVMGTPSPEVLAKLRSQSSQSHIEFDFQSTEGTGLAKLLPHASPHALDLLEKLLDYNPDDRLSAKQALRHAFFDEARKLDARQKREQREKKALAQAGAKPGEEPQENEQGGNSLNGTVQSATSATESQQQPISLPPIGQSMGGTSGTTGGGAMLPTIGHGGAVTQQMGGSGTEGGLPSLGKKSGGAGAYAGTSPEGEDDEDY